MNKVWNWIKANPAVIATFYWGTLAAIIKIWFPENGLPGVWENVYLTIGEVLTFLGVGPIAVSIVKGIATKLVKK